jgi:PTS system nitrogen regulatory IIA component
MTKVASRLGLDPNVITELLLDREEMMPTAINNGVAIPHPRDSVLSSTGSDAVITAFPEKPIEYGALDGKPVHTLFFLFSSSDKTHLHLLSKLAHLNSQPIIVSLLTKKPTMDQLLATVKGWEAKISNP